MPLHVQQIHRYYSFAVTLCAVTIEQRPNREAATLSMVQKLQPSQPPRQYTFRLEHRADLPSRVQQIDNPP